MTISGARANIRNGWVPCARPSSRADALAPSKGSAATAVMTALAMNGGQPCVPVNASNSGPMPNPADSAAA